MEIQEVQPEAERGETQEAAATESQRLADATFEPEAAVEQTSDFQQAEAIETAFVQAVGQTAGAGEAVGPPVPAPEEIGEEEGRLVVAPVEGGPEKILAEGIIGPVPRVEELPREQEPHIPEGPAPSGSGEPLEITPINLPGPIETAETGLTLDGKGGDLSSLDGKGNDLAEELGSPGVETMGWKVEEGDKVVSLDGKGNDLVDQPEYPKVETGAASTPIESIYPKFELGSGSHAMETPDHKLDMGVASPSTELPDHKFDMGVPSPSTELPDHKIDMGAVSLSIETPDHKVEPPAGSPSIETGFPKVEVAEGLEGKEPAYVKLEPDGVSWKVDRGLAETGFENLVPVFGRAVTDPQFRQQLALEPEAALVGYGLSEGEQELVKQIDPSRLETIAQELQTRFTQLDDPAAQEALGKQLAQLLWGRQG